MDRDQYLASVSSIQPGAFHRLVWERNDDPAAPHRKAGVTLTKRVRAVVRSGIKFSNLAVNADRETGPLPYGKYVPGSKGRLIETDAGKLLARVYINRVVEADYFVNGQPVSRGEYEQYLIPSKRNRPATIGGVTNITLDHIIEAGTSRVA